MATVQQHQQQQQSTTQLEFHQAMADFKTMFPEMDDDVIEAVLRSNQGAVDTTIDQLLAMSSDNENEKIRNEIVETTALSDHDEPDGAGVVSDIKETLRMVKGWNPPLLIPLPHDFLRLSHDTKQMEADIEDERIAMLLQNEEFMTELRWNKDFLTTLENDSPPEERLASFPGRMGEDDLFKERLRNMGKVSKKKFSQLARVFTGRKKRTPTAKAILNQGTTPSKDNLLLKEDLDGEGY
ncbi:CUE domain-containing protein 1 [Cimex lectularius]|uniref:CUE domain-containing protein n=1 Tax=Cimex lectularius TaxID=79782 RepID=A0A8I6RZ62_CIMLE|nr:CUE domain-containing protein 1 [Cimex lectularius]XP_014254319.1 CUE domain-containing protein 1 [Cimex lectularius]